MSSTDSKAKAVDSILIRRLYTFLKPYRSYILLALLLTLFVAWLGPLRPYITQIAIDDYISTGDIDGLWKLVGLFTAVLFGEFILLVCTTYLTRWIGQGALFNLRTAVFNHIQHLHVQYFDRNPIGRLITRSTSDIEVLSDLLSNGVVNMIGDLFRIVFIMYFMFALDWELALVSLTTLPVLFYATILFKNKVRVAFLKVRDQVARLNSFVQEHINGLAIVQMFGQEAREAKRFDEINAEHRNVHISTIFYFALYYPVVEVLSSIAMALVIWYGGVQYLSGAVTFGVLVAFIQYVRQFFQPIRDLSDQFNTMQSALASSERIFSVLDTQAAVKEPESPVDLGPVRGHIEFKDVEFRYTDNEPVLRGISFTAEPGTMVAIVGATGAGKSTIINLVTRFYDIQAGTIFLDGVDIRKLRIKDLRSQFGLVLQDNALFSGSILENITLGNPDILREDVLDACARIEADAFIQRLPGGLDYVLQERGGSLSMGQKQLICFLRAMVYNPKILILDEATSSIDSETEALVTQSLNSLMEGRTSIVIAHRLSTIQHAEKILVMHKGEIRETGTHAELVQKKDGIYRRLYELQYRDQVA